MLSPKVCHLLNEKAYGVQTWYTDGWSTKKTVSPEHVRSGAGAENGAELARKPDERERSGAGAG